jgi:HD-like signal output (HDOD) protein
MQSAKTIDFVEDDTPQNIAQEILHDASTLASSPEAYLAITRLLQDNTAVANDFAAVIERDAGLTVRLLKLVNSPFYGTVGTIDSIPRAITRIGLNDLESIVLSACAVQSFSGMAADIVDMRMFWSHSVYCAIAARMLAKQLRCPQPARLYVVGLLHDVGALAIYSRYPELAERSIVEAAGDESRLAACEREWVGLDHTDMGARLLEAWHIPSATCEAIRWHHAPLVSPSNVVEAGLVNVADMLANQSEKGRFSGYGPDTDKLTEAVAILERSGVKVDIDLDALVAVVEEEFAETIDTLLS